MQHTNVLLGLLQLAVPFYGLRLNRLFGTRQIGGLLVIAFLTLAALRLGGITFSGEGAIDSDRARTLVDALVPILLLIGMAHVEAVFKEQERSRNQAQALSAKSAVTEAGTEVVNPFDITCSAAQHFTRHLAVIGLYSRLLLRRYSDANTAEHQRRLCEETAQAARLSRRMLSAAGKHPLRCSIMPVSGFLARIRPFLWRAMAPGMVLEIKCAEHLPHANADAQQLAYALAELVQNAVEASSPGATIQVTAESVWVGRAHRLQHGTGREGRHLRLTVTDRGCGMDGDVQAHLFQPFFTTKDEQRHAGLGLASAKGLIEEHGGWIDVESQPDRGTSVHVYLPAVQ